MILLISTWNIGFPDKTKVVAQLFSDGTFVVSGEGDVQKYVSFEQIPWRAFCDKIVRVRFEAGVSPLSISNWFCDCVNLKEVENLPNSIQNLSITFCRCHSLSSLPPLPPNVTDLDEAFIGCVNLTEVPVIPEKVIYTCDTFVDCEKLSGRILLKGQLQQCAYMFQGACTSPGAELFLDYAKGLKDVAVQAVATATEGSHVRLGKECD